MRSSGGSGEDGEARSLHVLCDRLALLPHVLCADVLELGQVVVVLLPLFTLHSLRA